MSPRPSAPPAPLLTLGLALGLALALILPGRSGAAPPAPQGAMPQLLEVGPGRPLAVPSAAARIARDGATVLIAAGDYRDVAVWTQSRLTLRGVGGRARIGAGGRAAEGKAVWVIRGDRVLVEGVELFGARVAAHNGAGIRHEGGRLTLRDCRLHDNEMGIMTYNERRAELSIEGCRIENNGTSTPPGGRIGHNVYAGRIGRFTLKDSTVRDARVGHLVKSRAAVNLIEGNRLIDGRGASYVIDLSEGGAALVTGNRMEKSAAAPNRTAIAYGAERDPTQAGPGTAESSLLVQDNDYRVAGTPGVFVRNFLTQPVRLAGNRIPADTIPLQGPGEVR